jgi:hypothetical protein
MPAKKVLFVRDFRQFTGGHLKMLHYIQHVASSGFASPQVLLSAESVRDSGGTRPYFICPGLMNGIAKRQATRSRHRRCARDS